MGERAWRGRLSELAALVAAAGAPQVPRGREFGPLRDWLEHQKGLLALGALRGEASFAPPVCLGPIATCVMVE